MRICCLLFALALPLVSPAQQRAVDYGSSQLTLVITQLGVPVEAEFKKFTVAINFDPNNLAAASAKIDIDVASIATGSDEGDTEARRRPWLNAKDFPLAKFVSSSVKKLANNRYEAAGKLTIKGRTKDVALPFTLAESGTRTSLTGQVAIKRLDFAVGEGAWSDTETVADEVQVRYKLQLAPAGGATPKR